MERKNKILKHDLFIEYYSRIEYHERERKFCHHDMVHFLDVARLAMILNLKEQLGVDEEFIYAAALLHDIGRFRQYEDGTPHEKASAELAWEILSECGFDRKEASVIIEAISRHRDPNSAGEKNLNGLLYRADKMSRSCFCCKAEPECDWKAEKKNHILVY
ncbi:MAG: HD domain-containing protein [Clostridiales bacterium]|nr:HD domain-containing protein [Clostridiales bacterium]